jgi:hypothetical protein
MSDSSAEDYPGHYEMSADPTDEEIHETAVEITRDLLRMRGEPFKGYVRPPENTARVMAALTKALEKHPTLRVGQLIYAALVRAHETAPENFHSLIFNVYDEKLAEALEAMVE